MPLVHQLASELADKLASKLSYKANARLPVGRQTVPARRTPA